MSKPSKMKMTLVEDFPRGGVKKMPQKRKSAGPVQELFKTNDGEERTDLQQSGPKKKKFKHGKQKQQQNSLTPQPQKSSSTLESLRFSHIEVGMHVLCCVAKVGNYSLTMDLPGGLQGEVAITAISDTYTDQLSRLTSGDYEEEEEEEVALLKDMFRPGQILPCEVTALKIRSGSKKKIFLSMNPKLVNRQLEVEHLVEGMVLLGSVKSSEDHGYVVDVGVDGVTAFLANNRADKFIATVNEGESLKLGQVVKCSIVSIKNKHIKVSINPKQVDKAQVAKMETVVPGMKVSGTIRQVLKEGLVIEFDGQTGLVHQTHTPAYTLGQYKEGSEVKGTVLYTLPKKKSIHLSLLPHLSGTICGTLNDKFSALAENKTMPHNARVFDVMEWMVWFTMDHGIRALATRPHLRAVVTDMAIPLKKTFQIGDEHRCTVTGYNLMENVLHVHLLGKTTPSKSEESHKQEQTLEGGKTDAESESKSKKNKSEKGDKCSKDERKVTSASDTSDIDNVSEKKKKKKPKSESDIACETDNSDSVKSAKKKKLKEKKKSAIDISESETDDRDDQEVTDTNKRKVKTDNSKIQETKTKLKKRDRSIEKESVKEELVKETPSKKAKTVKEELVKETPSKKVKAVKEDLVKETPSKKAKTVKEDLVKETPSKKVKAVKEDLVKETPSKKAKTVKEDLVKETPSKKVKAVKEDLVKETPSKKAKTVKEDLVKETPSKKVKAVKEDPETPAKKTKSDKEKVVKETPRTERTSKEKLSKETPGKKDKGIKEKSVKETPSKKGKTKSTEESDSGVEVNKASDSDDEDMKVPKVGTNPPRLSLPGFSFSEDFSVAPAGVNDDSSDDEVEEIKPVKKTAHERRQERIEEEKKIYAYERQQLEGDQVPVSSDDFDRLVLQSPDSSLLWTRYMAFHLETAEIEKARTIAERALKTISFREEQEKLNVWLAYMNLENMYGGEAQLTAVFDRALQQNDPIKVYKQMVQVYSGSGKMEEAEKMYNTMTKKFSQDKTVWTGFGLFLFKNCRQEAARKLLQRCLKSLDKKDHVEMISKFAQMEYKQGEPQRGCTMFENILTNYPKRTDLWSVYLDMVIRTGSLEDVRNLFERVIHMKMSSKKMQFFFKKYMDFEKKNGDVKSVEKVKQKALEYVEAQGFPDVRRKST